MLREPGSGSMHRRLRIAFAAGLALSALVLTGVFAASSQAAYHLMKIREVHEGGGASADYVELQMYADGQNFVSGHVIRTYDGGGNPFNTFAIPGNVANGGNQRTILIADTNPVTGGVTPDFVAPTANLLVGAGGSACFIDTLPSNGIDCVAFGTTAAPVTNPSPVGTPVLFGGALAAGQSIERSIVPNCNTLLEAADDTDNSAADFALATPTPRNNATAPTETDCPETTITKGPKKKVKTRRKKAKAKFKFNSNLPNSTFECSVDEEPFEDCASPDTEKVKKGKHNFQVRAVGPLGGVDSTPAEQDWKVKRKRK